MSNIYTKGCGGGRVKKNDDQMDYDDYLAFAIVICTTDNFAMRHVRALLASTLAIGLTYFIAPFNCVAGDLLATLFLVQFLRMFQCNGLLHLLYGQMVHMILHA